jgi:hypothetical protein
MGNNIISGGGENSAGAKINLIVDLTPEDCFTMCLQLFQRLSDEEKEEIIKKSKTEN